MDVCNLHWAAGFIDGEGSFSRCGGTIAVQAVQVEIWPINKLYDLFDGGINTFQRKEIKSNGGVYYRWNAYGPRAAGIMLTLHPLLSPKRQGKIEELLDWWMKLPGHHRPYKTHCKHGHPYSPENTYVYRSGKRWCKACQKVSRQRYLAKKK